MPSVRRPYTNGSVAYLLQGYLHSPLLCYGHMQKFAPAMRVAHIYHNVDRPAALVIDDVPRAADTSDTADTGTERQTDGLTDSERERERLTADASRRRLYRRR